ncbi:MAG: cytochrome C [Flavobacteriales bacterium]
MKKRLGIISLFTLLFVVFIAIWDYSYRTGLECAATPEGGDDYVPMVMSSEKGVFRRDRYALDYARMPIDENHQRSLKDYYKNRAFPGAPPSIPHPVSDARSMGGKDCLQCHENGGFVAKWDAYAPVTPHPELLSCRQCHVVQKVRALFRATNFKKIPAPAVGAGANSALRGSPPGIPHRIQMRENCSACHAGPSAPREIRTSHPQRINCMQCHVPNKKLAADIGGF